MSISKINFIFIYAATLAAQATLEPGIASETLPSGGAMQIKMDLASPLPIIAANVRFAMDPAVFDGIEGASVFSPAGDAYGVALLRGGVLVANLASPQRSLGTQTGFPFLVVAARIRPGRPAATRVPIDLHNLRPQ